MIRERSTGPRGLLGGWEMTGEVAEKPQGRDPDQATSAAPPAPSHADRSHGYAHLLAGTQHVRVAGRLNEYFGPNGAIRYRIELGHAPLTGCDDWPLADASAPCPPFLKGIRRAAAPGCVPGVRAERGIALALGGRLSGAGLDSLQNPLGGGA
jgi:hypothetical protein